MSTRNCRTARRCTTGPSRIAFLMRSREMASSRWWRSVSCRRRSRLIRNLTGMIFRAAMCSLAGRIRRAITTNGARSSQRGSATSMGSPKFVDGHVRMGIATQLLAVDRGMEIVASFPMWKNTPILLGESDPEGCAACQGAQNGYRNGPLYGVTIAEATARTYELAQKYSVNLKGIVTWAFEFEDQPYFAGFRELATNGVDKPVLNVFRMLGMLGGDWVSVQSNGAQPLSSILREGVVDAPNINAMATRRPQELDILVWNYHDDDVATDPAAIRLRIEDLPEQKMRVEQFRMDPDHSNAYAVWRKMGSPQQPTTTQQAQLEKDGMLEAMEPPELRMNNSKPLTGTLEFTLPRQGVALFRLYW